MNRRSRRVAGAVVVAVVILAAWRFAVPGSTPAVDRAPAEPDVRRSLLVDLRSRLIPSAAGGWVAASPGDPSLELWLLAASQAGGSAAFDRALAEADRQLGASADDRALALVLAQVLPGPTAERARADRLAALVLERTVHHLDADPGWLAPLLQLSAGATPSADGARAELERRVGPLGCDRLPDPGAPLPAPGTSLTVALRVLAAEGQRCAAAAELLTRALRDPAWDTWIASSELADLGRLAGDLDPSLRTELGHRFDGFLAVGPDHPIDLGSVVAVQSARRAVDLPARLVGPLARHVEGQARHRGGLPGRSTLPPTGFDVAIVRQLVGSGLLPAPALRATREAQTWPDVSGPVDPVVDVLLGTRRPLRCAEVPDQVATGVRVSFEGVVADQAWSVVRRTCAGRSDLSAAIGRLRRGPDPDQQALRVAVAELAACRIDPTLLDHVAGARLRATGPLADDPVVVWARAIAADPRAACAATERT